MYFSEEMLLKLRTFIEDSKRISAYDCAEFEGEDADGIRDIIFFILSVLKLWRLKILLN